MSARPVVKTSTMNAALQEAAIIAAQDAIANYTTEQEIASAIKAKFEQQFPSTYVSPIEQLYCVLRGWPRVVFGCFST